MSQGECTKVLLKKVILRLKAALVIRGFVIRGFDYKMPKQLSLVIQGFVIL
jgi:hypothetical protein